MFLRFNIVIIVESIGSKHLFDFLVRTWRNLVYHRPRESNLRLVFQIVEEGGRHKTILSPTFSISKDASFYFVTIMRAIVHWLYRQWQLTCLPTLIEQCTDFAHSKHRFHATCQICIIESIAFFRDSKRNHLQWRIAENLHQSIPVSKLWVGLEGFRHTGNNLLLNSTSRLQANQQWEVIVGSIGLVDNFKIEGFSDNNTTVITSRVECIIKDCRRKSTENITATEVYPCRLLGRLFTNFLDVILRKQVSLRFPLGSIKLAAQNVC